MDESHNSQLSVLLSLLREFQKCQSMSALRAVGEQLNVVGKLECEYSRALGLALYGTLQVWRKDIQAEGKLTRESAIALKYWCRALTCVTLRAPAEANAGTKRIVELLLEYGRRTDVRELVPAAGLPEAQELVLTDPFAFLLAASVDRQMKAEVVWALPYFLREVLGHLEPRKICLMSKEELLSVIQKMEKLPRYPESAARTWVELATLVSATLGGEAARMWTDVTAKDFKATFRELFGVGPGIADMTAVILLRLGWATFSDASKIDLKPDVHVVRVMHRLGLINEKTREAAIAAARKLNPNYPGQLDTPLWKIGKNWCHEKNPDCAECVMGSVCPRIGIG